MFGVLTFLVFLPLVALPLVLLVSKKNKEWSKFITLAVLAIQFAICAYIFFDFDALKTPGINSMQLAYKEQFTWLTFSLGQYGVFQSEFFLGLDGLNMLLVTLSGLILLIAAIASWKITKHQTAYYSLFLILSATIFGCFASLDLLVFYIFFEFMLLPMYFLIGIWGGEKRQYAAIKFFLYTLVGSIFILAVMLGIYASVIDPLKTGQLLGLNGDVAQIIAQTQELLAKGEIAKEQLVHSFNMIYMVDGKNYIPASIFDPHNTVITYGMPPRTWAFLFLFIGFGIKLPLVPLHTWLPDAHVEAPTPMSVILAGILLKIGGYGLLRLGYAVFPDGAQSLSFIVGLVSMITIVYGAYVALGQQNLKRMIAYSSVSHMGFVTLGLVSINALGITGAVFQMVSHGLIAAMLFLVAGVFYDRTKNLEIHSFSGLASKMPYFTAFVVVAFFASLGLPGFSGFIGEVFVFMGAFDASMSCVIPSWIVGVSLLGLIITAAFYLWTLQRMFFGAFWLKDTQQWTSNMTDVNGREKSLFLVLGVLILLFGFCPSLLTNHISPSVTLLTDLIK
jgi:NADH-quinone oxidoreductase subunit M